MPQDDYRPLAAQALPPLSFGERFGIRSLPQLARDYLEVARYSVGRSRFQFGPTSIGLLRPDLSIPAYRGLLPRDGLAPIYNLFDRRGGGTWFSQRVSRRTCRDFRAGRLTYDEHDGTDFVCPVGTPLVAAAPGTVVMIRDRFLRGGLTVAVDHGHGVVTQYTHCSRVTVELGQAVQRGEQVALSGAAGIDLVQFFPLVPPHIHFLVTVDGRPVDPYLAPGEANREGGWLHAGGPEPSGPLTDDPKAPELSQVDRVAAETVAEACTDPVIQEEIRQASPVPSQLAALLEDSLHHDRYAYPQELHDRSMRPARPRVPEPAVRLTLPLVASEYRGAFFADSMLTRPL